MITRSVKQVGKPKVPLNVILYMPSLENKLESIALKRAIALKAEDHWNLQKKHQKISNHTRKNRLATIY